MRRMPPGVAVGAAGVAASVLAARVDSADWVRLEDPAGLELALA
ncbi:hypothetical protein PAP18089_04265 [Pandoraea apista]|uniref:Uncharacterized protein n=1 Tax=Pandoraea apista TaxID=93218 RepID=A0A5E5P9R0_9BURK|nr:hypothetical protein PAP18089_04265 [Pandoraea apista]